VKDRSEVLPTPYDATVSHAHAEPSFRRQTRKLREAFWLDTPASKSIVSLLSVACSAAVIVACGRSSATRGVPDVVALISTRAPSFDWRRETAPVEPYTVPAPIA
jgi:hypothetical protein